VRTDKQTHRQTDTAKNNTCSQHSELSRNHSVRPIMPLQDDLIYSLPRSLFQVFPGRPLPLWPCGIHRSTCLSMLTSLRLSVCPIQFQFLFEVVLRLAVQCSIPTYPKPVLTVESPRKSPYPAPTAAIQRTGHLPHMTP